MVGLDIFTGKKYDDICPSTHNMQVPNVTRKELEVDRGTLGVHMCMHIARTCACVLHTHGHAYCTHNVQCIVYAYCTHLCMCIATFCSHMCIHISHTHEAIAHTCAIAHAYCTHMYLHIEY